MCTCLSNLPVFAIIRGKSSPTKIVAHAKKGDRFMERKYWVPALEKAQLVLECIGQRPYGLRLADLARELGINKSSLYSLLLTMEELQWVKRDRMDTYGIGPILGSLGGSYFRNMDKVAEFHREAAALLPSVEEPLQLAERIGSEILYLAKEEWPGPVRIATEPGMRYPAHATALGKVMLAGLSEAELEGLYPVDAGSGKRLLSQALTRHSVAVYEELLQQLRTVREMGYAVEREEAVEGFCCVAAPVVRSDAGSGLAVSCTMPLHQWEHKGEAVVAAVCGLARKLSR